MERKAFLLKLEEVMELDPGTLNGSERLAALESWDSLAVMSFIALVDEHFGASVAPKQIADCQTVNDLLTLAGCPVPA